MNQAIHLKYQMQIPCWNTLHQITKCKNQSQSSLNLVAHIVRKQNNFYAIKGLSFEEIVLGHDATIVSVRAVSGRSTVPQVFIGGKHIGGSDDLEKYFA